jgi:hypothetical protein
VDESHSDIAPLMERAANLRDQFVADGWQAIDVDLDEPD